MAFGKRMRIANAITDLRRPPSIEYSDHQLSDHQLSPTQPQHSNSLAPSHSRTQSQSQSLPGMMTPATTVGHVHSYSMQSSLGSPSSLQSGRFQESPVNIYDDMKTAGPVGMGNGTAVGIAAGMSAAAGAAGVELGSPLSPFEVSSFMNMYTHIYIYFRVFKKGTPSRLLLSSSNLKESTAKTVSAIPVNGEDEERGHMSDVRLKDFLSYLYQIN